MKKSTFGNVGKNFGRVTVASMLAASCLFGVTGCGVFGGGQSASDSSSIEQVAQKEVYPVDVSLIGDGWNSETSSKAVVHFVGEDEDSSVDFYHATPLNSTETVDLEEGAYSVTVIPSVNADGSIYKCPEALGIVVADDSEEKNLIEKETTLVPAEEVSAEEMNKITADLAEALKKGDDSLTGEAGNAIVDKAVDNMANTGKVDKDVISSVVEEAKEDVAVNGSTATVVTPPSNDYSNNSNSNSNSNTGGSSVVNTPSSNNNANNNSGNSSSSSSTATQPQKTWVPAVTQTVHHDAVYNTVHHDATYTTVHHDAVTEGYSVIVCDDGYETTSEADMDNHIKTVAKETGIWYGDYTDWRYRVVSPAWDETVETSPAWDEQVLVSPAWDEEVVASEGHWEYN